MPKEISKQRQVEALQSILPPTAEVADMLRVWCAADSRYWDGHLQPCWLTANIEKYGKAVGSFTPSTRTLNLVPQLWRSIKGADGVPAVVTGVIVHEACHQAQDQFYRHLDSARGPRGKWFDTSHRSPSWSRAVEDVIQQDGLDVFCPVWHRSSGNLWHPWVPASDDWMTWERVDPQATFDGRKLLSLHMSKCFMPQISMAELIDAVGLPAETPEGEPIDWAI
jgi:hypothetical protein